MIGTGIFFFVSPVALRLGSRTAILAAWVAGALVASCGALCVAELAATYPETGGTYVYLRRAFGPPLGFLYAWANFLIMRVANLAIMALAFATFFAEFAGLLPQTAQTMRQPVALAVIVVVTAVNLAGVRSGAGLQNALTIVKLACLLAIIAVGAAYAGGVLEPHLLSIARAEVSSSPFSLRFGAALIPVMWTLGGWDESPFVAGEVRNPARSLPLSILGGLWLVAFLFLCVNASYLAILSPAELAGSGGQTATLAMYRALGPTSRAALSLALMVSTFGVANGMALAGARIGYAVGRDHRLFRWFSQTPSRTRVPANSLLTQAMLVILTIVLVPDPYVLLLYTGLAYWGFAALMALALIVLRSRDGQRRRPFRVWAYPWTPLLFLAASVGMAASVVRESLYNALVTAGILTVGLLVFVVEKHVLRIA